MQLLLKMNIACSYDWRACWSQLQRIIHDQIHETGILIESLLAKLRSLLHSLSERRLATRMIIKNDRLDAVLRTGTKLAAQTAESVQRTTDIITSILEAIRRMVSWLSRSWEAVKRFITWILYVPHAIISTIERWLTNIKHGFSAVFSAIKFFAKVCLLMLLAILFAWLAFKAFCAVRNYSARRAEEKRYARAMREAELRFQRDKEDRRREQERQERERAQQQQRERERQRKAAEEERLKRERDTRCKEQAEKRRALVDRSAYNDWLSRCANFLANKQHATSFPDPPSWPCTICRENDILKACKHTIERLYRASGKDLRGLLKEERLKWHPDRLSVCPPPTGEAIRAKAAEMFKIIKSLSDEQASS